MEILHSPIPPATKQKEDQMYISTHICFVSMANIKASAHMLHQYQQQRSLS